jgi:hypothetical protein
MADIGKLMLDQYKPPEVTIDCGRCRRHLTVSVVTLRKKFGNQRLDVIARMVARVGSSIYGPCAWPTTHSRRSATPGQASLTPSVGHPQRRRARRLDSKPPL